MNSNKEKGNNQAETQAFLSTDSSLSHDQELELGEYFLHIYLEQSQGLDIKEAINIKMKLEAMSQTFYSQVKEKVTKGSHTFWGEHFFFTKHYQSREELNNDFLKISVFEHKNVAEKLFSLQSSNIGFFQNSLLKIYSSKDHAVLNEWNLLTNPQKDCKKVMGFVRVSANFVRVGQPRVDLEQLTKSKTGDNFNDLEFPPNIVIDKKQIIVRLFRGQNIVKLDTMTSKADPYVEFELGGIKIKSKVVENSLEPVYNQRIYIPSISPCLIRNLKITCKDHDLVGQDDLIGCYDFSMDKVEKNHFQKPRWIYIYGAHTDNPHDKEAFEYMNKFPQMASRFKGKFLMSIQYSDVDNNDQKQCAENFQKGDEVEYLVEESFVFHLNIEYVQNIKLEPTECQLVFDWGGNIMKTGKTKYQQGVLSFFQTVKVSAKFQISSSDENEAYDQLPDLLIYVVQKDVYYCFLRIKPKDFVYKSGEEIQTRNFNMRADNSVSDIEDKNCGILSASISCFNKKQERNVQIPTLSSPKYEKCLILCNIYQAKDLLPSDQDGTADPRVMIYHLGSVAFTTILMNSLNPSWNQQIKLNTFKVNGKIPSLVLQIYDLDKHALKEDTNEFMGSQTIDLADESNYKSGMDLEHPNCKKWYKLRIKNDVEIGEILCSFVVLNEAQIREQQEYLNSFENIKYLQIRNLEETMIRINILGLRNLQSCGIFPVKKVQVKIDTSSMRQSKNLQEANNFNEFIINSQEQGRNPTLGSVVTFSEKMSLDPNHIPNLSCRVIDNGVAIGSNVIGTFKIDLGFFMIKTEISLRCKLQHLMNFLIKKQVAFGNEKQDQVENQIFNVKQLNSQTLDETIQELMKMIDSIEQKTQSEKKNFGAAKIEKLQQEINFSVLKSTVQLDVNKLKALLPKNEVHVGTSVGDLAQKQDTQEGETLIDYQPVNIQDIFLMFEEEAEQEKIRKKKEEEQYQIRDEDIEQMHNVYESIYQQVSSEKMETLEKKENKDEPPKKIRKKTHSEDIWIENPVIKEVMQKLVAQGKFSVLGYTKISSGQIVQKKQYRKVIKGSLDQYFLDEEQIENIFLFRGKKTFKKTNFWENLFSFLISKEEEFKQTGALKAIIEVVHNQWRDRLVKLDFQERILQKYGLIQYVQSKELTDIEKEILKKEKIFVYVHVLKAIFYSSEDYLSENDSYFIVKLGEKQKKNAKVFAKSKKPEYYESFEFEHVIPGNSYLKISFYDEDDFSKDDEIGNVVIDLERRFFDKKWRSLKNIPIEKQDIIKEENGQIVGQVDIIVDILTDKDKKQILMFNEEKTIEMKSQRNLVLKVNQNPQDPNSKRGIQEYLKQDVVDPEGKELDVYNSKQLVEVLNKLNGMHEIKNIAKISQRPPTKVQVRIVVWDAFHIPSLDLEDVSDLYVEIRMNSFNTYGKTDTHYRAAYNYASWNWRILFDLEIAQQSQEEFEVDFYIYDKDLISENDFICHERVNIYDLVQEVLELDGREQHKGINKKTQKEDKVWGLDMNLGEEIQQEGSYPPYLNLTLEVLSEKEVSLFPAGMGRSNPNQDPHLPEPSGRFQWSWNPINILGQLCGPDFKRNLCMVFILIIVVLVVFWGLPVILTLITAMLLKQCK